MGCFIFVELVIKVKDPFQPEEPDAIKILICAQNGGGSGGGIVSRQNGNFSHRYAIIDRPVDYREVNLLLSEMSPLS